MSLYYLLIVNFIIGQGRRFTNLNKLALKFTNILMNSGYFENSMHNNSMFPCPYISPVTSGEMLELSKAARPVPCVRTSTTKESRWVVVGDNSQR